MPNQQKHLICMSVFTYSRSTIRSGFYYFYYKKQHVQENKHGVFNKHRSSFIRARQRLINVATN